MRHSRTDGTFTLLASLAAGSALAAAACDALHFDFGVDGGSAGHGAACEELDPVDMACADAGPGRCIGGGEAAPVEIGDSLGCAPAGQALGIVHLDAPVSGGFDLYAWADPVPWIDSPFNEEVSLALFPDACGAESFGGGAIECDYHPWLLRIGVDAEEAYLHVQTPPPGSAAAGAVAVGFQIVGAGGWDEPLPPVSQAIECDVAPFGPLDDALLYPDPLTGAPRQLPFAAKPPAAIAGVVGAPWICGDAAAGWRQAGYLIRNAGDAPVRILGVHVRPDAADGPSVEFHFALFSCLGTGSVAPEQAALASSCSDHGDHPSKQIDVEVPVWDDDDPTTEMLLILQVPPGEGTELFIQMDVE